MEIFDLEPARYLLRRPIILKFLCNCNLKRSVCRQQTGLWTTRLAVSAVIGICSAVFVPTMITADFSADRGGRASEGSGYPAHGQAGHETARYLLAFLAVEIESTHTIDIDSFVPRSEIDRRYLDKPYYIVPGGKTGAEAFAVIRVAMKDKDRVALARIVMAHREHIIAVEPLGKGLAGTTLRYDYEVRSSDRAAY
jgi:hypothetical protein